MRQAAIVLISGLGLLGCGSQSLVERARATGALETAPANDPESASPDSASPGSASPGDEAPAPISGQADPGVFQGCAGRRVDPANEFIGCPGFMASVHRPVGYSIDGALSILIQDVKHSAYGTERRTVTTQPYAFQLDDRTLTGRRYVAREESVGPDIVDHHVAVALEGSGGKLLIAHCQANGRLGQDPAVIDTTCRNVLATILTGQVPASIYLAKAPYAAGTIAGRTLTTPDGCVRDGDAQRIRCGGSGQLTWYQASTSLVPLTMVARAKTQAIISSAQADEVEVAQPDAVPCTVVGVETTCIHHRLDVKGGPAVHFYQAKVAVAGDTVYAQCSGTGADPKSAVPAPCDQVFAW